MNATNFSRQPYMPDLTEEPEFDMHHSTLGSDESTSRARTASPRSY